MASPFVTTTMKITSLFFDRAKVRNAVDRATRRALSKAGADIRRTAKTSIKSALKPKRPPAGLRGDKLKKWFASDRARRSSKPGQPPRSHTGLLKRRIFFAFEPSNVSVVIGPEKLRSVKGRDVPHSLEFGGNVVVEERRLRRNQKPIVVKRSVMIAPRPYMGPALALEIPKLPKRWNNSVRGD